MHGIESQQRLECKEDIQPVLQANEPLLPLLQDLDSQHVEHGGRDFAGSTRENLTRE
jgi:hypothetical protein